MMKAKNQLSCLMLGLAIACVAVPACGGEGNLPLVVDECFESRDTQSTQFLATALPNLVKNGNFTAALGVPTLDGLGVDGDGAHAENEHILVRDLPRRAALLTRLLQTV